MQTTKVIVAVVLMLGSIAGTAQNITGPTSVTVGQTTHYVFDDGVAHSGGISWSTSRGTVSNQSFNGSHTYSADVTWSTSGTASLTVLSNSYQGLGNLSITVGGSGNPDPPDPPPGSPYIMGPTTVSIGQTVTYTFNDGNSHSPGVSWNTANGTASNLSVSGNQYSADIYWETPGTASLTVLSNDYQGLGSITVTVNTAGPDKPNTTFTIIENCARTTVRRNSSPGTGVEWFWQTSATGTSTSSAVDSMYETVPGDLYLRARLVDYGTWSAQSQYVGNISVKPIPVAPTPIDGNRISAENAWYVNLNVNEVPDATSYVWYKADGTYLYTTTSTFYQALVPQGTTQFMVESMIGDCPSLFPSPVSATLHPAPVITTNSGNGEIVLGDPVTLMVNNYTYDTYQWYKDDELISGATSNEYATTTPGLYAVSVTKGNSPSFRSTTFLVASQNYIVATDVLVEGVTDEPTLDNLTVGFVNKTIQYFDGVGRPMQSVSWQSSPSQFDVVQPLAYDAFGREKFKYLPYVSANDGSGWYKNHALEDEAGSYTNSSQYQFYQDAAKTAHDTKPYSETVFEPSPLNRVLKQGAPGEPWQPNTDPQSMADNTVKIRYEFNLQDEVLLFKYDPVTRKIDPTENGVLKYYDPNELMANKTFDEHNNEVIEFVDKQGRTVLKKVQYATDASNNPLFTETYYIYDDLGNLVFVLPPEGVKQLLTAIQQN